MPSDSFAQKSANGLVNARPADERYSSALEIARQLNTENTRAIKPFKALTISQILPVAVGVTGVALAGAVTLAKALRWLKWQGTQVQRAQEPSQKSEPEPIREPGRALAVISEVVICADPVRSTLSIRSRTLVLREPSDMIERRSPSE